METLLLVWMNEKIMRGDSVLEESICANAKQLFEELGFTAASKRTGPVKECFSTKGWFTGFRKRTGSHSIVRHGEAASGDGEGLLVVFTKDRLYILFKFTCTLYKFE